MLLETLSDYLAYHGLTHADACELFGRSSRTLKRWEQKPPHWVIKIIQMIGQYKVMPQEWHGWYFDRDFLSDPAGNKYHIDEVRSIFMTRQFMDTVRGDKMTICSMKQYLEERLKKQPVLEISLVESSTNDELRKWSIAL